MTIIEILGWGIELEHVEDKSTYGYNFYRIIDHTFGKELRIADLKPFTSYILEKLDDDDQPSYSVGYFNDKEKFIPVLEWDSPEWDSEITEY